jgi:hypothetical protein
LNFYYWVLIGTDPKLSDTLIILEPVYRTINSVTDPESGALLTPGSGIWDGKNPDPGSAKDIPDHIYKSLVTIIWVKNASILCCGAGSGIRSCLTLDPGSGMEKFVSGIRDKPSGFATLTTTKAISFSFIPYFTFHFKSG